MTDRGGDGMRFAKTHEWIKVDSDIATIGISEYAQKELGDVVYIELPKVGDKLTAGEQLGTIESTKAAGEMYSPISAEVVAVNDDLAASPQLINEDPMQRGWMVKVKIENQAELQNLMDEASYAEFIAKESD
ncbi:MAG: glycine cleavage system protein GcvH [Candidatus Omnitrophica bacterium]|nr:glycine cleavage system protein GcvH [Candidatus Omnitrophota bacterium]